MAKNETVRIKPNQMQSDNDTLAALVAVGNYTPANLDYTLDKGQNLQNTMRLAQDAEAQAEAALKTARDNANDAQWAFHNYILGAKDQIKAQYGDNSNEFQSLGLKKKSEYKSPKPSSKSPKKDA